MTLNDDLCYEALLARDRRFDGRFFTGVRTTGVFCRPICPARTPRRDNCVFFACAASARDAGFRPCLRCRPEAAPGSAVWEGTSTTVRRALRLITNGALEDNDIHDLAERLGVSSRHLRRLFARHLGTSPAQVGHLQRTLFAKQLLDETPLTVAQIARAAGFQSARRLHAAIHKAYGRGPRDLRRRSDPEASDAPFEIRLAFRPPFDWPLFLAFLTPRAIPGVECVRDAVYARTIELPGGDALLEVTLAPSQDQLLLRVHARDASGLLSAVQRVRTQFDLDCDPYQIAAHLRTSTLLAPLVARWPGLRVPGAWDGWELAVRAILGQQVSVQAATTLAARLVREYGRPIEISDARAGQLGLERMFPRPEALARASLARIGVPRARAETLRQLARATISGDLCFDNGCDLQQTMGALRRVPGIGDWTAQYVAMRALRDPDALPAGDLGLQRALATSGRRPTTRQVVAAAETWRPWRAYATLYLWNSEVHHAASHR